MSDYGRGRRGQDAMALPDLIASWGVLPFLSIAWARDYRSQHHRLLYYMYTQRGMPITTPNSLSLLFLMAQRSNCKFFEQSCIRSLHRDQGTMHTCNRSGILAGVSRRWRLRSEALASSPMISLILYEGFFASELLRENQASFCPALYDFLLHNFSTPFLNPRNPIYMASLFSFALSAF
ncbi:hypothetical protein VNO77_19246 [Canavalia gladiata]|uniref:Uncharacterized protein n=1 Tax=Canavalia gladiata TaxID=3824 RepID=A0AAN9LM48_CANGL